MHYKHIKTLLAQPERIWEKAWQFLKEIRKTPIDGDSETQIPEACLQPSKSKFIYFFEELQKLAIDAFGYAAHAILEQFMYATMSPHLKKLKKIRPTWRMAHMNRLLQT